MERREGVGRCVVVTGCGEAGGGGEGGEGEARFSGEGQSPLFLLDFAGISRRALGDAREPYTCRPSL